MNRSSRCGRLDATRCSANGPAIFGDDGPAAASPKRRVMQRWARPLGGGAEGLTPIVPPRKMNCAMASTTIAMNSSMKAFVTKMHTSGTSIQTVTATDPVLRVVSFDHAYHPRVPRKRVPTAMTAMQMCTTAHLKFATAKTTIATRARIWISVAKMKRYRFLFERFARFFSWANRLFTPAHWQIGHTSGSW